MGKRRVYTDEHKAQVHTLLTLHEGNVKRTARESGVAEQTVRDWKKLWERDGVPQSVEVAIPAVVEAATEQYEKVRDKALEVALDRLDDPKTSARDATWIAGVMTDKIRLLRGEATSRTEQLNQGPTATEIGDALVAALGKAVQDQERREAEVIDGEIVEEQAQVALPPVSS